MSNKKFILSEKSLEKLSDVHTDLVETVILAITFSSTDFCVIEGMRDQSRQAWLFAQGKSKTMNSRHLTGHAVDLAPIINGAIPWNNWEAFESVARAMQSASLQLGHAIVWGGVWAMKDGPHFELSRKTHP